MWRRWAWPTSRTGEVGAAGARRLLLGTTGDGPSVRGLTGEKSRTGLTARRVAKVVLQMLIANGQDRSLPNPQISMASKADKTVMRTCANPSQARGNPRRSTWRGRIYRHHCYYAQASTGY
jgi:hypothetical protein